MAYVEYETIVPQEEYLTIGVFGFILGFLLIAYFFMYTFPNSATKSPTRPMKDPSKHN